MLKGLLLGVIPGASGSPLTGSLAEPAKAGTARASTEVAMRSKSDLVTAFDIGDIPFLFRSFYVLIIRLLL
jgi:hypothetical protein